MTKKISSLPHVGLLPSGERDAISDVAGVQAGHATLAEGALQTGVTVVLPHGGDVFMDKVPAAVSVVNGFGKSAGLVQVQELGVLETPIALTNTFSVGAVVQAQIRQSVAAHPEIGRAWATINPLVLECNDGYLSDIQAMAIDGGHYLEACRAASTDVVQGAVGAGRGMSCFGLKGGIGTSSRIVRLADGRMFTVGAMVLTNFGVPGELTIDGERIGRALAPVVAACGQTPPEKGSIIMLLATDAPLDARQLRRVSLRAAAGLARTGSFYGHQSGDISLAFSTAYTLPQDPDAPAPAVAMLHETWLEDLFRAAADSTEQAILNSLWHAETVVGRDGHRRCGLKELLSQLP
ncbi:MAG TPA: P1 family peptidase, partial [Holophaga sp.]|nr:P1 family peptidase [Holophaga sp.]